MKSLLINSRYFFELCKSRLTNMVVITALCGAAVAPGKMTFVQWLAFFLGAWGIVGSANVINCYLERDIDGLMERTKNRPLVTGKLKALPTLWAALLMAALSLVLFQIFTNPLTTFLGFMGFILYIGLYTPLKRLSMAALFLGAIPGAIPPMMGWTFKTGSLELGAWVLFGILFFWQLPHFIAISLNRQNEYENAGLKTLPGSLGREWAYRHMLFYSFLLVATTFLPFYWGLAGYTYLCVAMLGAILFLGIVIASFLSQLTLNWSRLIFFGTLIYLPVVLGVWVVDQWMAQGIS